MFKKLKMFWKTMKNDENKPLSNCILYLLKNLNQINLYSNYYVLITVQTLEIDVIRYIEVLKFINSHDLAKKKITIRDISVASLYNKKIYLWYSDNDNFISISGNETNNTELYTFLTESLILAKWCEKNANSNNLNVSYNYRRIIPYYTNIKHIVKEIHNGLNKKNNGIL